MSSVKLTSIPLNSLAQLPNGHRYLSTSFRTNAIQRIESPNVIRVPAAMRKHLERLQELEAKDEAHRQYRRNRGPLIISSSEHYMNHFGNREYGYFNPALHLSSWGWKNATKSHGKKFSVVAHAPNPSFNFHSIPKINPVAKDFDGLGLDPVFLEAVKKLGLKLPTLIQSMAIPNILKGANVMCAAETGSGKTLAYLLPLLQNVLDFQRRYNFVTPHNSPRLLILVPSRELVIQTEGVLRVLQEVGELDWKFHVMPLLHSESSGHLMSQLAEKNNIDVAIGTPQIVANLIHKNVLKSSYIQAVVLDEVDTLIDDSFVIPVLKVLSKLKLRGTDAVTKVRTEDLWLQQQSKENFDSHNPQKLTLPPVVDHAQLLLVGATLPVSFEKALQGVVENDSFVRVTTPALHRLAPHVHHKFFRCKPSMKDSFFLNLLNEMWTKKNFPPTMVFCNRNDSVHYLQILLNNNGIYNFKILSKHADEEKRSEALSLFHQGLTPLLLCSDLASRGLDTSMALNILNFEFPSNMSDYIHRAGRVGRVGSRQQGRLPHVYSIISQKWEVNILWEIERSVRLAEALPEVDANIKKKLKERHNDDYQILGKSTKIRTVNLANKMLPKDSFEF